MVLWKKEIGDVTLVVTSRLALHLVITAKGQSWMLTIIYNSQVISDHKRLWNSLNAFNSPALPGLSPEISMLLPTKRNITGVLSSIILLNLIFLISLFLTILCLISVT